MSTKTITLGPRNIGLGLALVAALLVAGFVGRSTNNPAQPAAANGTPAPGYTSPPAAPPASPPVLGGANTGSCHLDKIGTWSEQTQEQPYRIEVGGGGTQHVDFYPQKGVKSVSFIVPPQEPVIWWGFGSTWEGNGPECANFDWVKDATGYAQGGINNQPGRLDNGHSGLVVDLRSGTPQVVANVANMSQSDIDQLLALDAQAANGPVTGSVSGSTTTGTTADCQNGVRGQDHNPVVGQAWKPGPANTWRIVNFWSNQPGVDQAQHKLLLQPGQNPGLLGGGSFWHWPSSCGDTVQKEFAKNSLPAVTLAKLQTQGLVR